MLVAVQWNSIGKDVQKEERTVWFSEMSLVWRFRGSANIVRILGGKKKQKNKRGIHIHNADMNKYYPMSVNAYMQRSFIVLSTHRIEYGLLMFCLYVLALVCVELCNIRVIQTHPLTHGIEGS